MASPSTASTLLLASAAVAVLFLSATPASAGGRTLLDIVPEEVCRTASFPEVCMAMLGTVEYKTDLDLTVAMLKQSQAHVNEALVSVASLVAKGGATGKQGEVMRACKGSYEQAARDLGESVKYFNLTPEITHVEKGDKAEEMWHRYTQHLLTAAKDAYDCSKAVQDCKDPVPPALRDVSGHLVRFLYTAYDLCTRTQEGI